MQHVEDSIDALLEELSREAAEEKPVTSASPAVSRSRLAGFFGSLVASIALQRNTVRNPYGRQPALAPIDVVLQKYPHLSPYMMCV